MDSAMNFRTARMFFLEGGNGNLRHIMRLLPPPVPGITFRLIPALRT
jgi:hypothetical protein